MQNTHSIAKFTPAHSDEHTTLLVQTLKICVVFDDSASAQSAEVLIKHTAPNVPCDLQLFHFDELEPPVPGIMKSSSDRDKGGSLVVGVIKSGEIPDPDSSLMDYLKTAAVIGGPLFFLPHQPKFGQATSSTKHIAKKHLVD